MNKITKKGRVTFLEDYLLKKDKDNTKLFDYLESKDLHCFIKPQKRENDISYYKYMEDISPNLTNKIKDTVKTLALLHSKTSVFIKLDKTKYISVKDNILSYNNYLKDEYRKLLESIEIKRYYKPSEIQLLYNYSKFLSLFDFIENETKMWFSLVENRDKERVCMIHNNMDLNHIIINNKTYFISWDKSCQESPIKDLIDLYHIVFNEVDFSSILEDYLKINPLRDDELKLLFINLAIPKLYKPLEDDFKNTSDIVDIIDYINRTEDLIRPYYSK